MFALCSSRRSCKSRSPSLPPTSQNGPRCLEPWRFLSTTVFRSPTSARDRSTMPWPGSSGCPASAARYPRRRSMRVLWAAPVMIVDTHVLRVLERLRFVPASAHYRAASEAVTAAMPAWGGDDFLSFHIALKHLGQENCLWDVPQCSRCPLAAECPGPGTTHQVNTLARRLPSPLGNSPRSAPRWRPRPAPLRDAA